MSDLEREILGALKAIVYEVDRLQLVRKSTKYASLHYEIEAARERILEAEKS